VKGSKKEESSRERFVRLATARTKAVLDSLRVLGHCSNYNLYEYNEQDVEKIFGAIDKEFRDTRRKFRTKFNREPATEFSLE